jgi:hypothetical protein
VSNYKFFITLHNREDTTDGHLTLLLQQRRERLLHLKTRWSSPLASTVRFDCHVTNAVDIAQRISCPTASTTLVWTIPVTIESLTTAHDDSNLPEVIMPPEPLPTTLDSNETLLTDILTTEPYRDTDIDDDAEAEVDTTSCNVTSVDTLWALPVCSYRSTSPMSDALYRLIFKST